MFVPCPKDGESQLHPATGAFCLRDQSGSSPLLVPELSTCMSAAGHQPTASVPGQ
jgi:hypothetical protein